MENTVSKKIGKKRNILLEKLRVVISKSNIQTAIFSVIAFILPNACLFSGISPFCPAFLVAAAPHDKRKGAFLFLSSAIRYFMLRGKVTSLKYAAALGVFYFLIYYFQGGLINKNHNRKILAAVFGVLVAVSGVIFDRVPIDVPYVVRILFEILIISLLGNFFIAAIRKLKLLSNGNSRMNQSEAMGGILLLCTALSGLMPFSSGNFSFPRIIILFFVAMFSSFSDFQISFPLALTAGALAAFSDKSALVLIAAYTLPTLVSTLVSKTSRMLSLLSFSTVGIFSILYFAPTPSGILWASEILFASVLAFLFPQDWILKIKKKFILASSDDQSEKMSGLLSERINMISDTFKSMYETIVERPSKKNNPVDITYLYEKTANKVCKSCPNAVNCWINSYDDTIEGLRKLSKVFQNERIDEDAPPSFFTIKCTKTNEFLKELKKNSEIFIKRQKEAERDRQDRQEMGKQYVSLADSLRDAAQDFSQKITFDEDTEAEVMDCLTDFNLEVIGAAVIKDCDGRMRIEAKIKPAANLERSKDKLIEKVSQATGMTFDDLTIDNVGNGCRLIFIESQPIIIKYAKQQRIKGGETVSGDKITAFRTGNGKYVIFLSDGMGSGEEAAADSHLACATVQKILRSGLSSDMALRALNTVFMLKDREEAVTTLDFSIIDLESGETEIIKAGAAPTYIKNGNDIIKIKSGSVPAGVLDKLYFDRNMIKLGQGSILLMISDGMISDGDDDYIIDHLKNFEGQDPELLLSEIIEAALLRKDALSDDMSAAICILEEKD